MNPFTIESVTFNVAFGVPAARGAEPTIDVPTDQLGEVATSSFGDARLPTTNPTLRLGINPARLAASLSALGLPAPGRHQELTQPEPTTSANFGPMLRRVGERNRTILDRLSAL
jgi:hypothetical protein